MNTNKFLVGGIIGGITNFLFGWLVWGMLLMNFMKEHTSEVGKTVMRADEDMIWWSLIVANLLSGFLLSYILSKAGVKSAGAGAAVGAVTGLLFAGTMDLMMYSFMNLNDLTSIVVDVLASMVVTAIVGAIIGWYFGRGAKTATA